MKRDVVVILAVIAPPPAEREKEREQPGALHSASALDVAQYLCPSQRVRISFLSRIPLLIAHDTVGII